MNEINNHRLELRTTCTSTMIFFFRRRYVICVLLLHAVPGTVMYLLLVVPLLQSVAGSRVRGE